MSYTIDAFANAPWYGYIPMGVSNFGGDIQIFNVPEFASGQLGIEFNPQALASLNGAYGYTPANNWGYPLGVTSEGLAASGVAGIEREINKETSGIINTTLAAISSYTTKLNSALTKEGITDEEKTKINEQLTKLKEQETKLNDLKTKTNELSAAEANKLAKEIQTEVGKIVKEINTSGTSSATASGNETSSASGSETPSASSGETPAASGGNTPSTTSGESSTTTSGASSSSATSSSASTDDKFSKDVISDVQTFKDSMKSWWGTSDDFENILNKILNTESTTDIMDYLTAWNLFCSGSNGESFMQAFIRKASHSQKVDFGRKIMEALLQKAYDLGIYAKCSDSFTKIDNKLDECFIPDDVYKDFDAVIEKIAEKMGGKYKKYMNPSKKVE